MTSNKGLTRCALALLIGLLARAPAASAGIYKELTESPTEHASLALFVKTNPYAEIVMRPVDKFCRGLINTMTGVLEIPRTVGETAHKHGLRSGATTGVAQGIQRVGLRTGAGVIDLLTFPAPPYHRLYIKPEFVAGASSLYRSLPSDIHWEAVEPMGPPLPHGPLAASITVLTAPLAPPEITTDHAR